MGFYLRSRESGQDIGRKMTRATVFGGRIRLIVPLDLGGCQTDGSKEYFIHCKHLRRFECESTVATRYWYFSLQATNWRYRHVFEEASLKEAQLVVLAHS